MGRKRGDLPPLPAGEQPVIERMSAGPVVADTFAGRIHVEWDNSATVTPLGQLPFFIEYPARPPAVWAWRAGPQKRSSDCRRRSPQPAALAPVSPTPEGALWEPCPLPAQSARSAGQRP